MPSKKNSKEEININPTLQQLLQSYLSVVATEKELVGKVTDAVASLPDNPAIKRLSANSFVMSSSALDSNLTLDPFTYDFKAQYQRILDHILKAIAQPTLPRLELLSKIATQKKEIAKGRSYIYHDQALQNVRPIIDNIINELRQICLLQQHNKE